MKKIERKHRILRVLAFLMMAFIGFMQYRPVVCHADAPTAEEVAEKVTNPMKSLIIVVITVIQVIGVFILVKNVSELVHSIQDRDSSGIWQAGRGLAAAALLISIRWIIQLFGYTF